MTIYTIKENIKYFRKMASTQEMIDFDNDRKI